MKKNVWKYDVITLCNFVHVPVYALFLFCILGSGYITALATWDVQYISTTQWGDPILGALWVCFLGSAVGLVTWTGLLTFVEEYGREKTEGLK